MTKQALLIVDMQQGLFQTPRPDVDALVERLNTLSARLRASQTPVIFIQHRGAEGDDLHPSQPGHELHGGLTVEPGDTRIAKSSCDAFLDTDLAATLSRLEVEQLIVTGFATDFCVDTTVRSALGRGYPTIAPPDGHTTGARPGLSIEQVIAHHNFVWANLQSPAGAAQSTPCDAIA